MQNSIKNIALVCCMQICFALTFPIGKIGLNYAHPLFLTGIRMTLAGILLLGYHYCMAQATKIIAKRDWYLFIKTSIFYIYLSFVPEFFALNYISSLKSNIMWSAAPFVSALFSHWIIAERLTTKKWIGLMVGFVGMLPLIFIHNGQEVIIENQTFFGMPEVLMAIAITSTCYAWFLIKKLMNEGYQLAYINGITMFIGGLLCFITEVCRSHHVPSYSNFSSVLGIALLLILLSNVIGYTLYGYLLKYYSITFLSLSGFLCPLFGIFFSHILLNEHVQIQYIVSLSLVLAGLLIFYRDEVVSIHSL